MSFATNIPMPGQRGHAYIEVPQPLTDSDWAYLLNLIASMHDGLVVPQVALDNLFNLWAGAALSTVGER